MKGVVVASLGFGTRRPMRVAALSGRQPPLTGASGHDEHAPGGLGIWRHVCVVCGLAATALKVRRRSRCCLLHW
jgi:hypothetical protein